MNCPLVSIGLPVYNGDKWVEQAIQSLVDQTYPNTEIIIADDCSSDNTSEICVQFSNNYTQVKFIQNNKNLGGQGNFERILSQCGGMYFVYASQDDYWDKDFVTVLVEKLEGDKNAILVGCSVQMLNSDDKESTVYEFAGKWNPELLSDKKLIYSLMMPANNWKWIKYNLFFHGLIKTEVLNRCVGNFPGIVTHDRHFILLLALSGKWCYVNKKLYFRRSNVGLEIRKKANDPIYISQKNPFSPLIGLFQMFTGVYRMSKLTLKIKFYTILIVIAHTLVTYFFKIIGPPKKVMIKITYYILVKKLKIPPRDIRLFINKLLFFKIL